MVLGLLTVGLALASAPPTREAVPLVVTVAIGKFGIWMLVAGTLLLVDRLALGWFGDDVHRAVLIYACLPCATCGIVFALQLDLAPARGAAALLASLAISLVAVTSLLAWLAR